MAWTSDLVAGRFDTSEMYANNALDQANVYMEQLQEILQSLVLPDITSLDDIEYPESSLIDYNARPLFSTLLEDFPSFDSDLPMLSNLADIPDIDYNIETENINFNENTYTMDSINIPTSPDSSVSIDSITTPDKPDITLPTLPVIDDFDLPVEPIIALPDFDAVSPTISDIAQPAEFIYADQAYNSDIRLPLFNKILYDIQNGGTGLDVTVEADIYDRGIERQRVENERLYREVGNQFSASGFNLPPGSMAYRVLEVSNEISRKTDQLNREITINQAELAQKNTQFTTEQAVQIEASLMAFYNTQQTRLFEAAKTTALIGVEVFNALLAKSKLELEKYQTEATVFETKIRSELVAVEIYKAKIDAVKSKTEIQQARVNIYVAQLSGIETLIKLYTAEMDAAKIKAEIQQMKIDIFRSQVEAYATNISAEKLKVDIFSAKVDSEKSRAAVYGEKVRAYGIKIDAKKTELEAKQITAENILKQNQLLIEEYKAAIDGYKAEITANTSIAGIQTDAFKVAVSAYEAETSAQEMQYSTQIKELEAQIDLTRVNAQIAVDKIKTIHAGYIALKELQAKGTEGIMNTNAQLAASAMNAVNVSASQGISSSTNTSYSY